MGLLELRIGLLTRLRNRIECGSIALSIFLSPSSVAYKLLAVAASSSWRRAIRQTVGFWLARVDQESVRTENPSSRAKDEFDLG